MNQTFKQTKETNALSEAYTAIDNLATKLFYDFEVEDQDVYDFLKNTARQINLYRVALIKGQTT
jgi:hypothetical protein